MRPILTISIFALLISCNMRRGKVPELRNSYLTTGTRLSMDRLHYSLDYLSDWSIDSTNRVKNAETEITFHSPVESGLMMFFVFDYPHDEAETLENHIARQLDKTMKGASVRYFTNWGNYKGHGAILKGRNSEGVESKLALFVYSTEERSFLSMSIYADSYADDVVPGLNVIESSFRMK